MPNEVRWEIDEFAMGELGRYTRNKREAIKDICSTDPPTEGYDGTLYDWAVGYAKLMAEEAQTELEEAQSYRELVKPQGALDQALDWLYALGVYPT